MPNNSKTISANSICLLTSSVQKREAANNLTAKIKNSFPAGIGQPALRALASAGFTNLEKLTTISETELKKLHGMGAKAIEKLRTALTAEGKSFLRGEKS